MKGGAPAQPDKGLHFQVALYPVDANNRVLDDVYPANRGKEQNAFSVPGKTGKGVPPGKYRITVRMTDADGDKDRLQGAFGRDNSPIIREVTSSGEIVIDLANPSG